MSLKTISNTLTLSVLCLTATPVGIIIQETPGTMALHLVIIRTENTPILAAGMTMDQCPGDTGTNMSYLRLKQWI